jgi:hypothetical protein
MPKKPGTERPKSPMPTMAEFMRNPKECVAAHPEIAEEFVRSMIDLAALAESPHFQRTAELAEHLQENDPRLFEAFSSRPAAGIGRLQAAVISHQASTAAAKKPKPAWHAEAKREAQRLIASGTSPRNVAAKIARMQDFSRHDIKTIRAALK